MSTPPYDVLATVDLGSNSFRLQIARVVEDQLYSLDSLKEMVRLGAGLATSKMLDEATQQRALACLARFGERLRGLDAGQVRIVGTNTLRVAHNAADFIARAEALLGFPIEIIAGREEARLIYLGAAHSLPSSDEKRLVIDIGGGSTEFIIGQQFSPDVTESLPLGCVTYTMRFFPEGKLTKQNFREAILAARNEVQRIVHEYPRRGWDIAVGTSGTARALRDVLELNQYSTTDITLEGMEQLKNALIRCGQIKDIDLPGIKSDRAAVLPGGLAVMIAIFEELSIDSMIVAEGALRDGVLYDLLGRQREQDMRDTTVAQFCRRYHVDADQAERVAKLARTLFDMVAEADEELDDWRKRVQWAAMLHEIGLSIAHAAYHKHSAYILQNADMPGFSRREQSELAEIVLGHRGDTGKMRPYLDLQMRACAVLAVRLAVLLQRRRAMADLPPALQLERDGATYLLSVDTAWLEANPLTARALAQEMSQWRQAGLALVVREA